METNRLPLDRFWYLSFFSKICRGSSSFVKILQKYLVLYMKTFSHFWQYLAEYFFECEVFRIKVVEKIKTHILCTITLFRKSCRLWDNVEKYGRAREARDDIIRRTRFACCICKASRARHTHTLTHSLRTCNTYCFSTAKMVSSARLSVMFFDILWVFLTIVAVSEFI